MHPLGFIIGIIFGSAAALSLGLGFVLLFVLMRQNAHPALALELPSLLVGATGSVLLMVVAGFNLWLSLDDPRHEPFRPYKPWAFALLLAAVGLWGWWLVSLR